MKVKDIDKLIEKLNNDKREAFSKHQVWSMLSEHNMMRIEEFPNIIHPLKYYEKSKEFHNIMHDSGLEQYMETEDQNGETASTL